MNPTVFPLVGRATCPQASRAVLAFALLVAALALLPPAAQAAAPPGFVGLQSWKDPTVTNLKGLKASKVSSFRMQLNWARVEPVKPTGNCAKRCTHSRYRWEHYDAIFVNAARNGVRIMPVLIGSPPWALTKAQQPKPQNPPMHVSHRAAFYQFSAAAANRYGPGGTLWRSKKINGAALGAREWQVWNEVNLKNYWNNRPSPTEYNAMVRGTYDAIKRGDPGATTVLAGMPWTDEAPQTPLEFWKSMFKADSQTPPASKPRGPISKYFSAFAIHPYATTPAKAVDGGVRPAASVVRSLTPRYKRNLWITEMGWATGKPDRRFQVSESNQAAYLKSFFDRLVSIRGTDRINGAYWFALQDNAGSAWYNRTGLLKTNGSPKPSWSRLKCVTGARGCK